MRSTWIGAGATAALVVPSAVLGAAHGDVRSVLSYAPMALAFGVVGSVVLASRPRHLVGVLFSTTGVVVAFLLAVEQLARTGVALSWPTGAVSAAAWLAVWPIELTVGLIVFSFLLFPDGRLPSSRWRPVLLAAGVTTGVGLAMAALTPRTSMPGLGACRRPWSCCRRRRCRRPSASTGRHRLCCSPARRCHWSCGGVAVVPPHVGRWGGWAQQR